MPAGPAAPAPGTGGMPGSSRETTSTISLGRTDDGDLADDLFPDSASFGALPPGSALLLVMRGPTRAAGSCSTRPDYGGPPSGQQHFPRRRDGFPRHAEFYRHGFGFTVHDVGSLNGTYVNRERIEEAELTGGDEVQIGKFGCSS